MSLPPIRTSRHEFPTHPSLPARSDSVSTVQMHYTYADADATQPTTSPSEQASIHPTHQMSSPSNITSAPIAVTVAETGSSHRHDVTKKSESKKKDEFEPRMSGFMGEETCIGMDRYDTILVLLWIAAGAVMIWYTTIIWQQFQDAKSKPTTAISYEERPIETFPVVTICNWNAAPYDNETNTWANMTSTGLQLVECANLTSSGNSATDTTDCTANFTKIQVLGKSSNASFTCYQFNAEEKEKSSSVGYNGGYAMVFNVLEDYISMDQYTRVGIQVSFTRKGQFIDAESEYNFIPVGYDAFYAMQKREDNKIDGRKEISWTTTSTLTALPRALLKYEDPVTTLSDGSEQEEINGTYPYIDLADEQTSPGREDGKWITGKVQPVAITFGYHTLSVMVVEEQNTFTTEQFMGAFGGMLGLLMGIDCIKVGRVLLRTPSAWIDKSPRAPLEEIQ